MAKPILIAVCRMKDRMLMRRAEKRERKVQLAKEINHYFISDYKHMIERKLMIKLYKGGNCVYIRYDKAARNEHKLLIC